MAAATQGTPKGYYHAAARAKVHGEEPQPKRRRTERIYVDTPHGTLTTLCDFKICSAVWAELPPTGPGAMLCKVCCSRLKQAA